MKEPVLDIVIVTYNRLEKLKKTLLHYQNQTEPFRNLIIIDNNSNDGTSEFLDEWIAEIRHNGCPTFVPVLISTDENLGGSGGFYLGEKKALELGADWVMVADDDAYAASDMVEMFYLYLDSHDCGKISSICSEVLHSDGTIALQHRDNWSLKNGKYFKRETSKLEDYDKESFPIDLFSYVGTFLNACALRKYGLVNPDLFIYYDDSEHAFRMKKYGAIIVVPSIKITHDDAIQQEQVHCSEIANWRDYYRIRNQFHMFLQHLPKVAYRYMWWQIRDWILHRIDRTPITIMENDAKWDAFMGRLGKHKKYAPGWKSTSVGK